MSGITFNVNLIELQSVFKIADYIVWGGSMARTPDGKCHLYFSFWLREKGFETWVTDSQIGYAVSDNPLGPFEFKGLCLEGSGISDGWDRDVTHNPTVNYLDGKFYLYYTGNYGNGEYWNHRNNQRIGVAVAEAPEGPWKRFNKPLLDVCHDGWDCLITTNPSVTRTDGNKFIMVYKAAGKKSTGPMYGPVLHGIAFADSPLGPFSRHPEPIFATEDINFPGEDPFVFSSGGKLYTIIKDMDTFYTSNKRVLVLFESTDGIDWKLSDSPLVAPRTLCWSDGRRQKFHRLERPQLYLENGRPSVLFCAVKPDAENDDAYNIHFKVS